MKKKAKSKSLSYESFKTSLDVLFALIFLIIGFPFYAIIALLVKFSSRGPIFYLQERIGKNKKLFKCIKFRTMHAEADDMFENLIRKNEFLKKEFEENHKLKNDPRITSIGTFLRKTSLDEIPQFINVLRLEMSIVGPRPIVVDEMQKYGNSIRGGGSVGDENGNVYFADYFCGRPPVYEPTDGKTYSFDYNNWTWVES